MNSPFRQPRTVRRYTGSGYVNHKWVKGNTYTDFTILASLHPLSGVDIQFLPEGERSRESYKIVTDTKLKTIDESNENDLVLRCLY